MGNLFFRHKEPTIIDEDDQFFDCLNDDEPHEHNEQNIQQTTQTISHYYAVWIPSNVETIGNEKEMLFYFTTIYIQFLF